MLEKQLEITISASEPLQLALCIPVDVLLVKIPEAATYQKMCFQGKFLVGLGTS